MNCLLRISSLQEQKLAQLPSRSGFLAGDISCDLILVKHLPDSRKERRQLFDKSGSRSAASANAIIFYKPLILGRTKGFNRWI